MLAVDKSIKWIEYKLIVKISLDRVVDFISDFISDIILDLVFLTP